MRVERQSLESFLDEQEGKSFETELSIGEQVKDIPEDDMEDAVGVSFTVPKDEGVLRIFGAAILAEQHEKRDFLERRNGETVKIRVYREDGKPFPILDVITAGE